MDKVSVIVPVYNSIEYLEDCLKSLLTQSYLDFEIVLVDDGSQDGSAEVCQNYARENEKIDFICVEHGGVINARKTGLEHAKGKYVAFVDSDDWVDSDYIETMVTLIGGADIVACGIIREGTDTVNEKNDIAPGIYKGRYELNGIYEKMLCSKLPFKFGVTPYMCNKLYRRDMIRDIYGKLDCQIYCGEDVIANCTYMLNSSEIVLSDICKYHYRENNSSATHNKEKYYLNSSLVYQALYCLFENDDNKKKLIAQLEQYFRFMMWNKEPELSELFTGIYFPFRDIKPNSNIVLYGAGKIGDIFYHQIKETDYCNVVAWIDANAEIKKCSQGYMLSLPETIRNIEYENIIIAIKDKKIAIQIASNLRELGVEEQKMIFPERLW